MKAAFNCSEGTCTYEDGAVYTGDWHQDQRSGWGKHTFANGDWYEGEWANDTMHGQGRLTITDGSYYECAWQQGQPQKGKWCSADGKTEYEGHFKGMLWHGFGVVHQRGVRKYMGETVQLCSTFSKHVENVSATIIAAVQQADS